MIEDQGFVNLVRLEWDIIQRRLRGMAMVSRGIVPNLVISQRVIDRIRHTARQYIADETGEAMVGLVVEQNNSDDLMPTIHVLDTISPDDSTIRRTHMFEQGDDLQGDIYTWLLDNWAVYREIGRDLKGKPIEDKWDIPLKHLGDWHKQPGYMIQPSGGDLMTALTSLDDDENAFEFLLVPIVTLGHPATTIESDAPVNYLSIPMDDGTNMRIDWWYIHRDVRFFQPITPRVMSADDLPALTPYPWHILDVDRLDEEDYQLSQDALLLVGSSAILWETDGDLPLEICFMVARQGLDKMIIAVTNWDYPQSPPEMYFAPFKHYDPNLYIYDNFELMWEHAERIEDPPDWEWLPTSSIAAYIRAIEEHLDIRPVTKVQVPVETDEDDPGATEASTNTRQATDIADSEDLVDADVDEDNASEEEDDESKEIEEPDTTKEETP